MSEAIILIAEENIWTNFFSRQTNKHIHWILQVGGSVLSIAGVAIKFDHKNDHFESTHAITGIISVSFIFLVALLGVFAFFAVRLRKMLRPVIFKFLHNFLGVFCFVIGMTSLLYGLEKRWMKKNSTEGMAKTCIIFTYAITLFSLLGAIRSLFNQAVSIHQKKNVKIYWNKMKPQLVNLEQREYYLFVFKFMARVCLNSTWAPIWPQLGHCLGFYTF